MWTLSEGIIKGEGSATCGGGGAILVIGRLPLNLFTGNAPSLPPTHYEQELFATMEATGADFTMTFLGLMALDPEKEKDGGLEEVGRRAG